MDPDANLKESIQLSKRIIKCADSGIIGYKPSDDDVVRLAELVLALNEWRLKGGYTPEPVR